MRVERWWRLLFEHHDAICALAKIADATPWWARCRIPSRLFEGDVPPGPELSTALRDFAAGQAERVEDVRSWLSSIWTLLPDKRFAGHACTARARRRASPHEVRVRLRLGGSRDPGRGARVRRQADQRARAARLGHAFSVLCDLIDDPPDARPLGPRRVCDASADDLPDLPARARRLLAAGVPLVGGAVRDALRGYPRRDLDFVRVVDHLDGADFHASEADADGVSVIEVGDFLAYVWSFDSPRNQVWIRDGGLWTLGDDDPRDVGGYPWNITSCRGPANYLWRAARMASRGLYADRLDLDMAVFAATAPGEQPAGWRVAPRPGESDR